MENRNQEETIRAIRNTSQHHPPRQERSYELKHACRFDNGSIRRVRRITAKIANANKQKGEIHSHKEAKKHNGGFDGA